MKTTTADRLKYIMQIRNLRQVDILNLAKPFCEKFKIKLGRNDLSQYVSGKVSPGQDKLTILAKALDVNEAWLMGYDVSDGKTDSIADLLPELIELLEDSGYSVEFDESHGQLLIDDNIYDAYHLIDLFENLKDSALENNDLIGKLLKPNCSTIKNIFPIKTKRFPLLGTVACGEPVFDDGYFESYVDGGADIDADFCLKCKGDSMIGARIEDGDIVFIHKQPDVENGEIAAVIIDDEATLKRVNKNIPGYIQLMPENSNYEPIVINLSEDNELHSIRILGKAVAFQGDVK